MRRYLQNIIDFLNSLIFNVFSIFSQFRTSKVLQDGKLLNGYEFFWKLDIKMSQYYWKSKPVQGYMLKPSLNIKEFISYIFIWSPCISVSQDNLYLHFIFSSFAVIISWSLFTAICTHFTTLCFITIFYPHALPLRVLEDDLCDSLHLHSLTCRAFRQLFTTFCSCYMFSYDLSRKK